MNFYQDWTPVVFEKKKNEVKRVSVLPQYRKIDENRESFEHKKISKKLADAVKVRRIELGLTQEQLANKINERPAVVNDVEAMRGVYDHVRINKLLRVLGLTLKQIYNDNCK